MPTTAEIIKANAVPATMSNTSFVPKPNSSSPQAVPADPVVKQNAVKTAPSTSPSPTGNPNGFVLNADGSTNYNATLEAIKTKGLELQRQAQQLAVKNDTPATDTATPSTVFSSSSKVIGEENKSIQDVNALTTDNVAVTNAHNEYLANLKAENDALEARRVAEEASINASFDTKKTQAQDAQTKEKGTFSSTLARIGGYLGNSASATGALVNLNQAHQFQLNDLESKRQAALSEARNAITEKQFAIARLKAQEAKDYVKAIADNKQQFFDNSLKVLNEQRQQNAQARLEIKDKLANLSYLEPSQISPETKKEIDQFYGTPGFTDAYINVSNAAAKSKTEQDKLKVQKDMLELLQAIPAGQVVPFADGTEYEGIGKTSDISTFQETDANGYVRMFAYNKGSGEVTVTNIGAVGKPSTNGVDMSSPRIIEYAQGLQQLVDPKTGNVPVNVYIETYRDYIQQYNGKGEEFLKNFDPIIWTGRPKEALIQSLSSAKEEE